MAKCIKCGYDPDVKQVDDKELEKEIKYLEDDIKNESKITPEMAIIEKEYYELAITADVTEQDLISTDVTEIEGISVDVT